MAYADIKCRRRERSVITVSKVCGQRCRVEVHSEAWVNEAGKGEEEEAIPHSGNSTQRGWACHRADRAEGKQEGILEGRWSEEGTRSREVLKAVKVPIWWQKRALIKGVNYWKWTPGRWVVGGMQGEELAGKAVRSCYSNRYVSRQETALPINHLSLRFLKKIFSLPSSSTQALNCTLVRQDSGLRREMPFIQVSVLALANKDPLSRQRTT